MLLSIRLIKIKEKKTVEFQNFARILLSIGKLFVQSDNKINLK